MSNKKYNNSNPNPSIKTYKERIKYELNCNNNFFNNLNSENSAYWAGFILADGNVNRYCLRIELAKRDISHLEKFKKVINSGHVISESKKLTNGKEYEFCTLAISRKKICDDLTNHGIGKDKSEICYLPIDINPNYMHHFIRGLFDGDGSFYLNPKNGCYIESAHFKICSPVILILYQIQNILMKECSVNRTKIDNYSENCCSLVYNGNDEVRRIMNYLYKNATVYLERKHELFINHYKNIDLWRNGIK